MFLLPPSPPQRVQYLRISIFHGTEPNCPFLIRYPRGGFGGAEQGALIDACLPVRSLSLSIVARGRCQGPAQPTPPPHLNARAVPEN